MVTTSYPEISGRQRRHLHGADCRVGRGTRARGPCRRALAPARGARAGRTRRPFSFLQIRAVAGAECFRLRGGAARGRDAARRGTGGGAAGARGRMVRGAARRAAGTGRPSCTATGWFPVAFTACGGGTARPQVVSLHGSDVYVAETFAPARRAARLVFDRAGAVTACSADLAQRSIAPWRRSRDARSRAVRRRHGPVPPAAGAARRRCARSWAWREGTLARLLGGQAGQKEGIRAPDRRVGPPAR